jgi:hypothetical protein
MIKYIKINEYKKYIEKNEEKEHKTFMTSISMGQEANILIQ